MLQIFLKVRGKQFESRLRLIEDTQTDMLGFRLLSSSLMASCVK